LKKQLSLIDEEQGKRIMTEPSHSLN